jgi:hypothetical protein
VATVTVVSLALCRADGEKPAGVRVITTRSQQSQSSGILRCLAYLHALNRFIMLAGKRTRFRRTNPTTTHRRPEMIPVSTPRQEPREISKKRTSSGWVAIRLSRASPGREKAHPSHRPTSRIVKAPSPFMSSTNLLRVGHTFRSLIELMVPETGLEPVRALRPTGFQVQRMPGDYRAPLKSIMRNQCPTTRWHMIPLLVPLSV